MNGDGEPISRHVLLPEIGADDIAVNQRTYTKHQHEEPEDDDGVEQHLSNGVAGMGTTLAHVTMLALLLPTRVFREQASVHPFEGVRTFPSCA